MPYKVLVDDNFHFTDKSERYTLGEFDSYDKALDASKDVVDRYLRQAHTHGMTANDLFESYTAFGDDPWILETPPSPKGEPRFSARDYAREKSNEMCSTP